jgi:antitoxin ParD1/3/4
MQLHRVGLACGQSRLCKGIGPSPTHHCLAFIDIYCQRAYYPGRVHISTDVPQMSSSLNVQLTDELRRYVDERASDKDVYATPSEYIRDLIRQDMQDRAVALNILEGMADLRHGRFSDKSILDLKEED